MEVVRTLASRRAVCTTGGVSVAEGILLAVSVAVFIYLGIAIFIPERF
jgi:K+-transporting ATPase KdpF subunit